MMDIIALDPQQKKKAARVLAVAFFDYPMFTFYFPDPKRRTRYLPWYLENVLNCALRYGEVFTNVELSGVLFYLPPGHTQVSLWEYIQNGFFLTPFFLGLRDYVRSMDCEAFVANTHEKVMGDRPHYYLWGLAVDPAQKRKGVGTALMKFFMEIADEDEKPIYLETHDEANVAYYHRMGFNLAYTDTISKYGLQIWCMIWEPDLIIEGKAL
jgi:ribosomal protein S18 acetylase RimI-like enzyme